jgi:hypothetical protein
MPQTFRRRARRLSAQVRSNGGGLLERRTTRGDDPYSKPCCEENPDMINEILAQKRLYPEPFYRRVFYGLWYIFAPQSYLDNWEARYQTARTERA